MRNIYSLNENWIFSEKNEERKYDDTEIKLPFIHDCSDMPQCEFSCSWKAQEKDEGQAVYLCFSQISGDVTVYNGEELKGSHKGSCGKFNILLTESAAAGEEFNLKIDILPLPRTDGKFVFGTAEIATLSSSHFDMDKNGALRIYTELQENTARIRAAADIIKPNNYDVVAFTVCDASGEILASKTAKPTMAEAEMTLELPEMWGGPGCASLYTLKAVLQRDSTVLDETELNFGIKDIKLSEDGFLYLSNIKLPLSGVCLTDCSALKKDTANFRVLDGNCIGSSVFPVKSDLLSLSDERGNLFWYEHPSGSSEEALTEFLLSARSHPSFVFAALNENADLEMKQSFDGTVKKYAPGVFTAAICDINNTADFEPYGCDIIGVKVPYTDKPEAYIGIGARFRELAEKFPDRHFAVIAAAPHFSEADAKNTDSWHIKLWDTFCREKRVILYLVDTFSDSKNENGRRGLTDSSRKVFSDAFWFYKAQFSAQGFIKISPSDVKEAASKSTDIRCFTNLSDLRILINGKDKKYTAEKLSDGVYVYRNIKLKKGENLIEVSAGDECDSAEIIRS